MPVVDFVLCLHHMKSIWNTWKEKYKIYRSSIKGAAGIEMELNPEFKDVKLNQGTDELVSRSYKAKFNPRR